MEKDSWVRGQLGIVSFVDAIIVQDHMHFSVCRKFCHHLVHEVQELNSSFKRCYLGVDPPAQALSQIRSLLQVAF